MLKAVGAVALWSNIVLLHYAPTPMHARSRPDSGTACGVERWAQKTLTDASVGNIDAAHVRQSSVAVLGSLPLPSYDDKAPRHAFETHVVQVDALVLGAKSEADEDFHIVLADPRNPKATMVAEIPAPECVTATPPAFRDQILKARVDFVKLFGSVPTAKYRELKQPLHMSFVGVVFGDKLHGQTGVAKNGIELHPVLSVGVKN